MCVVGVHTKGSLFFTTHMETSPDKVDPRSQVCCDTLAAGEECDEHRTLGWTG